MPHLGEDGIDHRQRPPLGHRTERLGHVDLTERFAHVGAEGVEHPLDPFLLFLLPLDQAAVEGEVLVVEPGRQRRGRRAQHVEPGVGLEHRDVGVGEDRPERSHVPGLLHVHRRHATDDRHRLDAQR